MLFNVFRFIDDLAALNNCLEFEGSFHEIYPPLPWIGIKKKENLGYLEVLFLDPMIFMKDKKLIGGQFFIFSIMCMPYQDDFFFTLHLEHKHKDQQEQPVVLPSFKKTSKFWSIEWWNKELKQKDYQPPFLINCLVITLINLPLGRDWATPASY